METLLEDSFPKCKALLGLVDGFDSIVSLEHQDGDCRTKCNSPKQRETKKGAKGLAPSG